MAQVKTKIRLSDSLVLYGQMSDEREDCFSLFYNSLLHKVAFL